MEWGGVGLLLLGFFGVFFGVEGGGGGGVRIVVVRYLSPTTLGNNNLHGRTSPYRFFFYIDIYNILNSLYNLTRHPLRIVWKAPKGAAPDTAKSWPQGDKSG